MKLIKVNQVTYAVDIHQQQEDLPTLLMLHGFMGDHRAFAHLIKNLSFFCNPVTIDLLGFGQSSKPTDPDRYDTGQQVADIDAIIKKLNTDYLYLFGYSMGGRLALQAALSFPDRIQGLILESTTCGILDANKREERRKGDDRRAKEITEDFESFLSGWENLDLFSSPIPTDHQLRKRYSKIQSEQLPEALAASLRGFGTGSMPPICDQLDDLMLPVQLMAGSSDQKYQRINRDLVKQFPNATFSSIEAGHRTHLDNPPEFISTLKHFIETNQRS